MASGVVRPPRAASLVVCRRRFRCLERVEETRASIKSMYVGLCVTNRGRKYGDGGRNSSGQTVKILNGHTDKVRDLVVFNDTLYSTSEDKTIGIWKEGIITH